MSLLGGLADIASDISAFANPFGAPSAGEWNLSKGIYTQKHNPSNSIIFFYEKKDPNPAQKTAVEQISDTGGRRIAEYEYPYRDGQSLADLGRKGETYVFNIKFFGPNYQQLFQQFLNIVLNDNGGGTLTHPIRSAMPAGGIPVRFADYEFLHRYNEWSAITIRATFKEDQTVTLQNANIPASNQDSALRTALQTLTSLQSTIQQGVFAAGALLLLPSAIVNAMQQRFNSIVDSVSQLLGQLAATFSSDQQLQQLAANGQNLTGGVTAVNSGGVQQTQAGVTSIASLPPVYQVGFDETTQAAIQAQLTAFINANQVSPQQAVYLANQIRSAISAAIAEVSTNLGNSGYSIMVNYRGLANAVQSSVQAAIASAQSQVTLYTVNSPMSLRMVAFLNGLTADGQNTLAVLNPYLSCLNYLPKGTVVTVPKS